MLCVALRRLVLVGVSMLAGHFGRIDSLTNCLKGVVEMTRQVGRTISQWAG